MAQHPHDADSTAPHDVEEDSSPGTQRADVLADSVAMERPIGTQAIFRPDFDDDDDLQHCSASTMDTEPQEWVGTAARVLPAVRQLGGGLIA
ncbi:MAG: serine/threonine protein kinase, partial [Mycobacteriaceae bacterium]|nr:serine/threonine protein kinase [Mycobacteriaceae bacterium]